MRLFKLLLLLVIIGFMGFSGYCRTEMSIMLTNLTNERLNKVKYTFGVTGSDPGEIVVGLGHVNGFGSYYSDAPPESKTISISPHDTLAIFQSSDCGTSINLKD